MADVDDVAYFWIIHANERHAIATLRADPKSKSKNVLFTRLSIVSALARAHTHTVCVYYINTVYGSWHGSMRTHFEILLLNS